MEFDHEQWLAVLVGKIRAAFGERALFIGLQGSRRRGEAQPGSDVDVVLVLDQLEFSDLRAYRALIASMPDPERACGFISGRDVISQWPKHEIFQLYFDTKPLYGSLDNLVPSFDNEDVVQSIRVGASALYHETCHRFLYGDGDADRLKEAYKSAFFVLQALHYIENRHYFETRAALLPELSGDEREILETSMRWDAHAGEREKNPERFYELLIGWTSRLLESL